MMTELQRELLLKAEGHSAAYSVTISGAHGDTLVSEIVKDEDVNATFETLYSLLRGAGCSSQTVHAGLYGVVIGKVEGDNDRFDLLDGLHIELSAEYSNGSVVSTERYVNEEESLYKAVEDFLLALQYTKHTIDKYREEVCAEVRAAELEKIEEKKRLAEAEKEIAREDSEPIHFQKRETSPMTGKVKIHDTTNWVSFDEFKEAMKNGAKDSEEEIKIMRKNKAYEDVSGIVGAFGNTLGGFMGLSQDDINKALAEVDKNIKREIYGKDGE